MSYYAWNWSKSLCGMVVCWMGAYYSVQLQLKLNIKISRSESSQFPFLLIC